MVSSKILAAMLSLFAIANGDTEIVSGKPVKGNFTECFTWCENNGWEDAYCQDPYVYYIDTPSKTTKLRRLRNSPWLVKYSSVWDI